MEIYCLKCGKAIVPNQFNVHIIGPDVEIICPYCHCMYKGKITSFVRDQVGGHRPQSASDAARMQRMAQYIELNSSEYYKKRGLRHGRKKVRDVRDRGESES
jgi:DNA-directed RNA polymerase subunit RPC12/RpoP